MQLFAAAGAISINFEFLNADSIREGLIGSGWMKNVRHQFMFAIIFWGVSLPGICAGGMRADELTSTALAGYELRHTNLNHDGTGYTYSFINKSNNRLFVNVTLGIYLSAAEARMAVDTMHKRRPGEKKKIGGFDEAWSWESGNGVRSAIDARAGRIYLRIDGNQELKHTEEILKKIVAHIDARHPNLKKDPYPRPAFVKLTGLPTKMNFREKAEFKIEILPAAKSSEYEIGAWAFKNPVLRTGRAGEYVIRPKTFPTKLRCFAVSKDNIIVVHEQTIGAK